MSILSASDLFIPEQQRLAFEQLRRNLLGDIQPINSIQTELFNSALRAAWTARRCDFAEHELALRAPGQDPLLACAKEFTHVQTIRRHADRTFRQAIAELRKLQTDRSVRMLQENKGLADLPVPVDAQTLIGAARQAAALKPTQKITFPAVQRVYDDFARQAGLGQNAWEAWLGRDTPAAATLPKTTARRAPVAAGRFPTRE